MAGGAARHVVHRRVHLERNAPAAKAKLRPMERRDDFLRRAKAVRARRQALAILQEKARTANKNEFRFQMVNTEIKNGALVRKPKQPISQDAWEQVPLKTKAKLHRKPGRKS